MLSTMSRKSKITRIQGVATAYRRPTKAALAQGCPRVWQNMHVRLAQPLLLERLERAVLLVLADLTVDVLEERGVSLADDDAVERFGADASDDLELAGTLLDQHLERRASLNDGVEPLGKEVLMGGGIALVGLEIGVPRLALRLQLDVPVLGGLLTGAAKLSADGLSAQVVRSLDPRLVGADEDGGSSLRVGNADVEALHPLLRDRDAGDHEVGFLGEEGAEHSGEVEIGEVDLDAETLLEHLPGQVDVEPDDLTGLVAELVGPILCLHEDVHDPALLDLGQRVLVGRGGSDRDGRRHRNEGDDQDERSDASHCTQPP